MPNRMVPTICIVDADPAIRDSLQTLLGLGSGHPIRSFATGYAFLSVLDTIETSCVLCEAELPDVSGFTVYAALPTAAAKARFGLLVTRRTAGLDKRVESFGIKSVYRKPLVDTAELLQFVSTSQVAAESGR